MKKYTILLLCVITIIYVIQSCIPNTVKQEVVDDVYTYCKRNGYNTEYCILVDFSKPSGLDRFYIYNLKERRIEHKSLCVQGHGVNHNILNQNSAMKLAATIQV